MTTAKQILTPVGRLVGGSLYKGSDKDAEGKPRTIKSGPNAGQPTVQFFFHLAVPKGAERHWAETAWGQLIWGVGHAAFPQAAQSPAFAWKVKDGDSQTPNRKGRKPCDNEGWPGHWILTFSSGYPPGVYADNGTRRLTEPDAVKPGYFIQVSGTVDGNGSSQQPGVFLNHQMVNLAAYGPEIVLGPDPTAVGFGQGVVLPPGASATPPAGSWAPGAAPGAPPAPPAAAAAYPAPPGAPPAPAAAPPAPPPPVAVAPNPGILAVPGAPGAPTLPPPPPAAPAAPVRRMTAAAGGYTYEQLIGAGWTDQTLIQRGYMEQ